MTSPAEQVQQAEDAYNTAARMAADEARAATLQAGFGQVAADTVAAAEARKMQAALASGADLRTDRMTEALAWRERQAPGLEAGS